MEEPTKKRKTHTSSAVKDRYNAKAYDEIKIRVKKGEKDIIKADAQRLGKSVNKYIVDSLTQANKPGMHLTGTITEVVRMLNHFDENEKISYVLDFNYSTHFAENKVSDVIKFIKNNDENEIIHIEIQ